MSLRGQRFGGVTSTESVLLSSQVFQAAIKWNFKVHQSLELAYMALGIPSSCLATMQKGLTEAKPAWHLHIKADMDIVLFAHRRQPRLMNHTLQHDAVLLKQRL